MNKKELEAFGREIAKGIKTPEDLADFSKLLKKITVEAALDAEMEHHLGYQRNGLSDSPNSRNGYTTKTLITENGSFEIDTPRDRTGEFSPQLVKMRIFANVAA